MALLAIHSPISSGFKVEHATTDIRILALTDFAFAVEIPNWFRQDFEHIRSLSPQDVINMMHGSDVGFSTLEGSRDAEQAHQVRVVCVKKLTV